MTLVIFRSISEIVVSSSKIRSVGGVDGSAGQDALVLLTGKPIFSSIPLHALLLSSQHTFAFSGALIFSQVFSASSPPSSQLILTVAAEESVALKSVSLHA